MILISAAGVTSKFKSKSTPVKSNFGGVEIRLESAILFANVMNPSSSISPIPYIGILIVVSSSVLKSTLIERLFVYPKIVADHVAYPLP